MKRVLVFIATLILSSSVYAAKFEYKVLEVTRFDSAEIAEAQLNKMGSEGWELVSVQKNIWNGVSTSFQYVFKRKQDD